MSRLGSDSRFYQALASATDLVVLNLAMVLAALPLITGGAVLTGGLVVSQQMLQGNGVRPLADFGTAFRRSFWPATVAWLGGLGLAGLLVWEWLIAGQLVSPLAGWLVRGLVLLVGLLAAMVSLWFWPLLARRLHCDERVRLAELPRLLETALLASLQHLPRSLGGLLVGIGPILLGLASPQVGARLLLWFGVIGVALAGYLVLVLLRGPLGIRPASGD